MNQMLPLWKAFPNIPYRSIGWRMGAGEDYFVKFNAWFLDLEDAERADFETRNPEPDDWTGYYDSFRADIPRMRELKQKRLEREKK